MARTGKDLLTQPAPRPLRYRHVPMWLVWTVVVVHQVGIEWMARHTTGRGLLQAMAEPEFNQSLALQGHSSNDGATGSLGADMPTTSTVGQVVQARTLFPAVVAIAQPQTPPVASRPTPTIKPKPTVRPEPTQLNGSTNAPQPADTPSSTPPTEPQNGALAARADVQPPPAAAPTPQMSAIDNAPPSSTVATPSLTPAAVPTATATDDPAVWLATWPRSTRLNYQLKGYYRGDFFGHARVQWQRSAQRYQAQIQVTVGLLLDMRMTSQGRITATRLWPEAYEEDRRSKKRSARFGDQLVTLDNGNALNRPSHLQDTASQFVQLAQDFAMKRLPLEVGAVIPVTLGRPGGIDEWLYDVVALETVATPLGDLAAPHHHFPAGISIGRLQPRTTRCLIEILRKEDGLGHRLAVCQQHWPLTFNPEVKRDGFAHAVQGMAFARQQIDGAAFDGKAGFFQGGQNRQRRAIGLAVIQHRAHASISAMIRP